MSRANTLSREEELRLTLLSRSQDPEIPQAQKDQARHQVILSVYGLIVMMAKRYARNAPHMLDDYVNQCFLQLCRVFDRFDPHRGPFMKFAFFWTKSTLRSYHLASRWVVTLPASLNLKEGFENNHVQSVMQTGSLQALKGDPKDSSLVRPPSLPQEFSQHAELVMQFIHRLPDRHQITLRGKLNNKSFAEIGEELKLSRQRVEQIYQHARRKIRTYLEEDNPALFENLTAEYGLPS